MQKVLILDYGSQYTQLIARRIREQRVYCEIHPFNLSFEKILSFAPKAVVLSGGPASVFAEGAPAFTPALLELKVPMLGICYGLQLLAHALGGKVASSDKREYGRARLHMTDPSSPLFRSVAQDSIVWMSHGDHLVALPPRFSKIAESDNAPFCAVADTKRRIYGVQFHPEVVHSEAGLQMLRNFLFEIAELQPNWDMHSFLAVEKDKVRRRVGQERVICGLSGGVDSAVAAALIHEAIGDQLECIFIDNGLLRKGEAREVCELFERHLSIKLHCIEAGERFLGRLRGVTDPEQKRKLIGNEFVAVFEEAAKHIPRVRFLAQGTLYPDVIESVSFKGPSATIKTHHNVGGLPEKMGLQLVEPLRELFKDEVRSLGRELGLPEAMIQRQPFPGPGLAIRILGEVTQASLDLLREADVILQEELQVSPVYSQIWQGFAVLLPVKTVGVMGDERSYEHVVALRCVSSIDGMTADWVPLPYELLGRVSNRIINEVRGINRVVYDISSKPPATIEWE